MRPLLSAGLLAAALASSLFAAPAQAAAARTFVSAAGSDSNTCSNVATPCRHLPAAYAATLPNGEIFVLDPANYGSLTITGPVSIEGHGWASIAPPAGGNAITINANPGDKINIIGVVLDGTGMSNTNGIVFNSGGSLTVRDSVIRNFDVGIDFAQNSSTPEAIFVSNTLVSDNGGDGIVIGNGGLAATTGVLDHVQVVNNGGNGLNISFNPTDITVADCVIANNASNGIIATTVSVMVQNSTTVSVMVRNCTIAANGNEGLEAVGAATIIRVTRSTIFGNGSPWQILPAADIVSYRDNNFLGNLSNNQGPPGQLGYH
jgi:hypothetical protein